ncbi:hypothetical protein ACO22_00438 [Paracoccidioides brasiliensis]|uniref:J domain-containing protein n=1 Tax=Paracoccidioides brasiliensis TaxID=121759 RepID=A0A1D2JPA4_PARBR|nr:hypothetical protein ACO22_00438 [Paracoccidioides brasiliensis]
MIIQQLSGLDYYKILEIDPSATEQQIRVAYKRAALKSHPDRVPATSPERPSREETFKQVNEAYYVLSEPTRRRRYDNERQRQQQQQQQQQQKQPGEQRKPRPQPSYSPGPETESASFASDQFGTMFEEMLREEGLSEEDTVSGGTRPTGSFWAIVGGLSGAALGFIVANFPGALAGAVAGNRLGAIRDSKGKSVYEVFQALPGEDKAKFLGELAARVLRSAVS